MRLRRFKVIIDHNVVTQVILVSRRLEKLSTLAFIFDQSLKKTIEYIIVGIENDNWEWKGKQNKDSDFICAHLKITCVQKKID